MVATYLIEKQNTGIRERERERERGNAQTSHVCVLQMYQEFVKPVYFVWSLLLYRYMFVLILNTFSFKVLG